MVSHQVDKSKKFFQKKGQGFKPNGKKFYGMKSKGPKDDAHHMRERNEYFNGRCSYYKKVGHKKIDCWKLKGKQEKKGNILMIETNIIDVLMNTWWLDIGATIHVTNSLQGMICQRGLTNLEQHVYMGDNSRAKMDITRIIKLKLATRYVFELQEVSYVPSIRRNLLSISLLDS